MSAMKLSAADDPPIDYLAGVPWHPDRGIETITSCDELDRGTFWKERGK